MNWSSTVLEARLRLNEGKWEMVVDLNAIISAADEIDRLRAALAAADRELDEKTTTICGQVQIIQELRPKLAAAERERDEARAQIRDLQDRMAALNTELMMRPNL